MLTLSECRRSLLLVAFSMMLIQASYGALESLQSSLNHETGTTSLALLFSSFMVSSLLLPPLVMKKIGCRKTLMVGLFTHAIYIAANFYPKPFPLYPAAFILGVGAGLLAASLIVYIINMSEAFALLSGKEPNHFIKLFFGVGYACANFGSFSGALVMSAILKSYDSVPKQNNGSIVNATVGLVLNSTSSSLPATNEYFYSTTSVGVLDECGLYYDMEKEEEKEQLIVPLSTQYLLLSLYVILSVIPAFLCLLMNDSENCKPLKKVVKKEKEDEGRMLEDEDQNNLANKSSVDKCDQCDAIASDDLKEKSAFSLLKSTVKLLVKDKVALLVISHTIHVGVLKAFARSAFNAAWITCWLGIEYIGYVMAVYSSVLVIVSFLSGYMLKLLSFKCLFGLVMLLEVLTSAILYFWKPGPNDTWMFFIVMCLFATTYGMVKTQTPSAYDKLFKDHREQGAALQGVVEAVGLSLMFALSGAVYPLTSLIFFCGFSILGYVLFLAGSLIKDKEYRYWGYFKKATIVEANITDKDELTNQV